MPNNFETLSVLYPHRAPEPIAALRLDEFRDAVKITLRDPQPEPQDPKKAAEDVHASILAVLDEDE